MKRIILLVCLLVTFLPAFAKDKGVLFEFRQKKGDSSVHVSTIEEEAYLNGFLNNRAEIVNRVSTTVLENQKDGSAKLHTEYMTTENYLMNQSGRHLSWGEDDSVNIYRKKTGELYDSDNDFLPTVRGVPVFPGKAVQIGETWTAEGMEVHDLRKLFNMEEAVTIPFVAKYKYSYDEEVDGQLLNVIECSYEFYQEYARKPSSKSTFAGTMGFAKQMIYWNAKKGDLDHYTEEFQIRLLDIYGNSYEFTSQAHGEVIEYKSINDDDNLKKIQKSVDKMNLDNISVKSGEKGLTISLDNIQFEADSDKLLESEKIKLQKIGEILKEFSNDLLITGHTALRGSANARQILSEERAEAVASYLEELGVRDQYHIFIQGKGGKEPVASNDTEEGRSKNRRVEITIMD
ncbi:MAG: OmpA family protein [Treponema sp.]|nr:OmpA family protein [Treponema sp.]